MLDPDISTRDALRLLTVPDHDPMRMGRRRFLQLLGAGAAAGAVAGQFGGVGDVWAGTPVGPTDGIVVLIGLFGGLDGLNTVVPYTNSAYYAQHGSLAVPAAQVLPLTGQLGLHPRLPYLKTLFDRGEVAIVQGVGYADPDLSHFTSMATWMQGHAAGGTPTSGWIGRWLDGFATDELLRAVSVGQGLPLHLVGAARRGMAVPQWGMAFGDGSDQHDLWMYDAMRDFAAASAGRGAWHDTVAATVKSVVDVGQEVAPVFARPLPDNSLAQKLTVAARLINADVGLRVVDTGHDGFDTHANQPTTLNQLLTDLDNGLRQFFTTLDDRFRSRVTVMTYSEFGRTSWSNDSAGTDHGTANNHFVIGAGVKGGFYGAQPSLAGLRRWDRMGFGVDFRSMYSTVIDGWLGGGSSTVLGANYPTLGFFKQAPGVGAVGGAPPTPALGDYVGITPARLYDSRRTPRLLPLGAGTTAEVQALGAGGVPATGVTAVALNVTAVNGTGPSSFAVWPVGGTKPDVANVTLGVNAAVAGLVTVPVGAGGRINVTNDLGAANCIVDVVGYFRTTAANRLQSITPFRALDTRNGTGGRLGALGPQGQHAVMVRGVGGVPANADSVVVNVTAVAPSANGHLTVWPSGQARPGTSTLNFAPGVTVPNLAFAKVGTDGRIAVFNVAGNTHVVIDVLGYFAGNATGRFMPLTPARLLDTTPDNVAPLGPGSTTAITARGVGGVPSTGVAAVALSVSARNPSAATHLTLWPSGQAKPNASNLNPRKGIDASNLAITRLGPDGKVNLFNLAGTIDVVVDVVGWFTS